MKFQAEMLEFHITETSSFYSLFQFMHLHWMINRRSESTLSVENKSTVLYTLFFTATKSVSSFFLSRKQPLENGTWLFNLDGILFGFPVVLSSLSAFSKEIVWAMTILLISQRLIRHSYRAEEWLHSGSHFITINYFTHLELIFPEGFAIVIRKQLTIASEKEKKQLFNRAADNDIFKENIQQRHASF